MQYLQFVQGTAILERYFFLTFDIASLSRSLRLLFPDRLADSRFSSTCFKELIPLRISETSGWLHTHFKARSAGDALQEDYLLQYGRFQEDWQEDLPLKVP